MVAERLKVLHQIKGALFPVSQDWAETAARKKLIPAGSSLEGEEWTFGPDAVMSASKGWMRSLSQIGGSAFLNGLTTNSSAPKTMQFPHKPGWQGPPRLFTSDLLG